MGKGKTVIEQPDPISPGEAITDYINAIGDPALQEKLLGAEARFRPQFQQLELADQEAALFGTDGQPGLIELQRRASEEFAPIEKAAKEREVAMLGTLGGQVTQALRDADPKAARMADLQAQQAERLYAESEGMLSPERAREAEQAARMAGVSRGRVGDASTIAGELLGREASRAQLRAEARQAGGMGFQQARAIGGDPSQFLFGRPAQSTQMGSQLYGQAYQLAGQQAGPQLFDPNQGINLAMQQRSQNMNLMGAQAQARATETAGKYGMIGSILGCWVAREVYGIGNPRWLAFRQWMLIESPSWFRNLYMKHGERFARFISNKPKLKNIIRKWMDTKIS